MVGFGIALLYNWLMGHFAVARRFLTRLNYLFRKNIVKIVLMLLSLLYVPMSTSIFSSFISNSVTCPVGTEFVHNFVQLDLDSLVSTFTTSKYTGVACKSCFFNTSECSLVSTLCPENTGLRLHADPSIAYSGDILRFYVPGSILAVFSIIVGIPWLFYKLIVTSSRFVTELPVRRELQKEDRWKSQCRVTSSSCRSLYTMFEYKWRHYKLITLIHKLIVVAVFIFGGGNSFALVCALVVSHSVFAIMSIYSRPYINKGEDILAIVCLLINVLNAVIALVVAIGVEVPSYVSPIIITLNSVFPVAAIVGGLYFQYLEEKDEKRRDEEKLARQLQARLERKQKKQKAKLKDDVDDDDGESDEESVNGRAINSEIMAKAKAKLAMRIKKVDLQIIDVMDQELDQRLLHVLVNFFLFLGLFSFLSLAVAILGVILQSSSTNVLYPNVLQSQTSVSVVSREFGGYASWTEFINNCCCQSSLPTDTRGVVVNATSMSSITETWKCILPPDMNSTDGMNILYKIRLRKYKGYDGTLVRPYCSKQFNSNYVTGLPQLDTSTNWISVPVTGGVPSFIAQNLW